MEYGEKAPSLTLPRFAGEGPAGVTRNLDDERNQAPSPAIGRREAPVLGRAMAGEGWGGGPYPAFGSCGGGREGTSLSRIAKSR